MRIGINYWYVVEDWPMFGLFVASEHHSEAAARSAASTGKQIMSGPELAEALYEQARSGSRMRAAVALGKEISALRTAAALANASAASSLEMAQAPADTGWSVFDAMQRLREALKGIGRVGPHLRADGSQVGDELAVYLTRHDREALILVLAKRFANQHTTPVQALRDPKLSVVDESLTT